MKIGIVTITDGANYGNRLQNYAMQQLLKKYADDVETLRITTSRDRNLISSTIWYLKDLIKLALGRKDTFFEYRKRNKRFADYNKKNLKFSNFALNNNMASQEVSEKYDFFVCGSDQIWNTNFSIIRANIKNYLATFAEGKKRIAFAASFGVSTLDKNYNSLFKSELMKFNSIALREKSGKDIVDKLIKSESSVVLDPTLLIEKKEWIELEKAPSFYDSQRFVMTYFLSDESENVKRFVEKYARDKGLIIYNLEIEFKNDSQVENKAVFCTSPDEFIWLVHHAECVFTDSFHASVFSIIFKKPFLVYERVAAEMNNDMSSRIDTLLNKFDLMECKDNIYNPRKKPVIYENCGIDKVIEWEKKVADEFLKKAFGRC